ncbi:MAG: hypothetical protein IJJ69_13500 [Oscillospiraceae bacterium]|nr:hypothetical protein [Oscillospiraceae bacterium]
MMREMSYRDKMILLIISVIIILAVGFFALIRPKYNSLVADRATYEETKTEWEGIDAKLQQIPVLKEAITAEYKDSSKIAEMFVSDVFQPVNDTFDNLKANYVLEQYIQEKIDESELKMRSLEIGGISSQNLDYYYYTPDVLTYSLLESADVNGNYAQQVTDLLKTSTTLSERETAEVMTNTLTLNLSGKKESLMAFLTKMIEEEENAVRVTSVSIEDYTFGEGQTQTITEQQTNPDGTVTEVTREVPLASDGQGESEMEISITFYNAMPIDQPVLGD